MDQLFDLEYLAYLFRYLTALLYGLAAGGLMVYAGKALSKRYRRQFTGVRGFFLLTEGDFDQGKVQSFPLYYTTGIGRAASADIQVKKRGVLRHHAQIFLFKGNWFIDKDADNARIFVNQELLTERRMLRHEDQIRIPGMRFVFIDERHTASESGVDFEATWTEEVLGLSFEKEKPVKSAVCYGFYCAVALFQLFAILPSGLGELRTLALSIAAMYLILTAVFGQIWQRLFRHFDTGIYLALTMLSGLGLLMQVRLSLLNRTQPVSWSGREWFLFLRNDLIKQTAFYFIGMLILPVIVYIISRTRLLEIMAPFCLFITPALYLITRVLGKDVAGTGARLWLELPGGFTIQLTEFAKISFLIVLSYFFMTRPDLKRQLFFAFWAGVQFILMLLMPDLGSMMILLPITLLVFTVMTSEYLKTGILLTAGLSVFALAYQFMPYVRRRIHGWLTLWDEVNAQNDQIIRGLQAIARGGIFGIGPGAGEPRSIPLASSDMIFAFLTEEAGLLTALSVVLLFMVIWVRGVTAFTAVRDAFSASLILGISSYFFIEAAVVIGGVSGLIPLTGVTLPFIARGGSSMLAKWFLAAILLGLWNRREEGAYRL